MAYYINKIDNEYNKYKYQYLDHMTATIDLRQNYWDFNMQLLMINDCYLPLNTLLMNLSLPYQEVKNLTFNLGTDQSYAKDLVDHNKKYAKIYNSKFSVDVSNNEYLKQSLNNAKLACSFDLEIDPEPITKVKTEIKQEDLDGFISETAEQNWSWQMYYTNTHLINQSCTFNNAYGYSLLKTHQAPAKVRVINSIVNNYSLNENPITELIHLQSLSQFKIEDAKVNFHYWIEQETEEKTLEVNLDVDKSFVNDIVISFDKNTMFDFKTNKVVIDDQGIKGLFIPKHSQGYYQLELKLSQDNTITTCVIKNNYTFNFHINKPHIDISSVTINNIDGYKRLEL